MTLHIMYNHKCPKCGAYYIPYDENVPCPNCGYMEKDRFDFIPRAVKSLKFNHEAYGSYIPFAWWISSLGDYIMDILFSLFQDFEDSGAEDFSKFAREFLSKINWKDHKYMEEHIYNIAMRVYEELEKEKESNL